MSPHETASRPEAIAQEPGSARRVTTHGSRLDDRRHPVGPWVGRKEIRESMLNFSKGFGRDVVLRPQLIITGVVLFSDQRPILPRTGIDVNPRHEGLSRQDGRIKVAARWREIEP